MRFVSDILAKGNLVVDGSVTLNTTPNATVDTDKFLVQDGTIVKYRTGAEVLLDIGAQGSLTLTTTGTTGGSTLSGNTLNIPIYQGQITLTVTGSSGAATLISNTLNIPTYTLSGLGGVPSTRTINGLALSNDQTFATGTTGTDFNIVSAGTVHTFNIPDASATNRGLITAGTQTIAGTKTFTSSPIVPSLYLANMGAGSGAVYYDVPDNRLTLANYNVGGEIKFEVNGGVYTMTLNSDLTIELMGYTTNGFLKTSGGNGLLVVDTTSYTPTTRTLTINGTSFDLTANRSWSVGTVTSVGLSAPTGFSVASTPVTTSGTIVLSFASGYSLPTNASQTNWDTAYNSRISSLTTTGTSGAATLVSNVLNIPIYQAQGSYITSLTGEATGSGPGATTVTLTNSAVIGKVLTGLSVTSGSIASTDSILQAFGKVQGQINALSGGLQFQGTWNANTNTPTITSGVGSNGNFYIVNVAGNTTIDGNTGWQVGDWILFDGTVWQKVDNTDAVSSVNGLTGAVVLTTTNISEGTNLYYTDARARQAISLTTTGSSGAATYSNVTGVLNIPQYTLTGLGGVPSTRTITINGVAQDLSADRSWSVGTVTSIATTGPITGGTITGSGTIGITQATSTTSGYLSSTDWNTFNNKQNAITLTTTGSSGSSTLVGATLNIPSYTLSGLGGVPDTRTLTINGTSFDLTANRTWSVGTVTSITFSGPLTGGTITGSGTVGITQSSGSANGFLSSTDWTTFNSKQNAITLTTTGSSGAATLVGATLNIPTYTLSGLGGVPTTRTITINGTAQDLSVDRSWSVGTVTSVSATAGTGISISGSPITSSGTLTITNTGVTSLTAGTGISVSASTGGITVTNTAPAPANTVTGTGTLNYVARWTSTSAIGTGILYDDGSVVCVNATGPEYTEKLRVVGGVSVQQAYTQVNALQRVGVVSALTTTTAGGAGYYSGLAYTALTGAHENIFNGSVTIPNSVGVGGVSSIATLRFNVSSVSVTMTQAAGFRAYSAVSGSIAFSTAQTGGSVSHVASFHALAPYYVGTNTPTITNYYGLLLNDSTEYNTWVAITNRWGVYQAGASDNNHFNGKVLIGTTVDAGFKLDVTGTGRFTSNLTANSFIKNGGTSTQYLMADGSVSTLSSPVTGTGTTNYIPKFTSSSAIGNSNLINDASGNLGLGVTPSAWLSSLNALQIGAAHLFGQTTGTGTVSLGNNAYLNSTPAYIYQYNGKATRYSQYDGQHEWYTAPSGTAGNAISFTQAMTLDASGRLGIGTTSPNSKLVIAGTTNAITRITGSDNTAFSSSTFWSDQAPLLIINNTSSTANTVAGIKFELGNTNAAAGIGAIQETSNSAAGLVFTTGGLSSGYNNPERMRITSGGNVGIGTTNPTHRLQIQGSSDSGIRLTDSSGNTRALLNPSGVQHGEFSLYNNLGTTTTYLGGGGGNNFVMNGGGNFGINTSFSGIVTPALLTIKASATNGNQIYIIQSNDDRGWRFRAITDGHFYLQSSYLGSDTDRFMIQYDTGNVGIGTTSPSAKLHIDNAIGSDVIRISDGVGNVRFAIGQESSYTGNYINTRNIDFKLQTYFAGGSGGNIIFQTANDGTANVITRMAITSGGNVEIRSGNSLLVYNTANTRFGSFYTSSSGTEVSSWNGAGEPLFLLAPDTTASIRFCVNGNTSSGERMRLNASGSLSIGSTTPDGRLYVERTATWSSGNLVGTNTVQYITYGSGASTGTVAISAVGAFQQATFTGSATIGNGGRHGAIDSILTVGNTSSGTITLTQSSTIRALSTISAATYYNPSAATTITHLAGIRVLPDINTGAGAITVNNKYGILIGDASGGSGSITYTTRWGIYQEGASDNNYFAAKVLIGTTTATSDALYVNGTVYINNNLTVNGTVTELSSANYKRNINTLENTLEKVDKMRAVSYNRVGGIKKEIGLIAEEVEQVYPEFVEYDNNGHPMGLNYARLTAVLLQSIKELNGRINELENRN